MKKLLFISLFIIPFCKAADPNASWNLAVQNIANWQQQEVLYLDGNQIGVIPDNLNLPLLLRLYLNGNHIEQVDLQIFEQFPNLNYLGLNKNPLTPENVDALREAAAATGREIEIFADDIGEEYLEPGKDIKGD